LGLSDVTLQQISNVDRPFGCYFKDDAKQQDGKLWLNSHPEAPKQFDDTSRASLCHGDGAISVTSFSHELCTFFAGLVFFLLL